MKVEVVAEAGAEIEAAFDYLAQEASERTASELLDGIAEAQKAIIATARRLAAEGVIAFGAGEDDYV